MLYYHKNSLKKNKLNSDLCLTPIRYFIDLVFNVILLNFKSKKYITSMHVLCIIRNSIYIMYNISLIYQCLQLKK